ncbi:hypothetical protein [Streptomyces celluloflavus]
MTRIMAAPLDPVATARSAHMPKILIIAGDATEDLEFFYRS